ncbi:hypothetical protein [Microbacterium enclense]|uniref:hypothetical protein n=1 Tax=Microbacterium enclense TaxID=993073 RepID=UPI003F7E4912
MQAAQSKQGGFFSRLFGRRPTMATTELTSDTFRTAPIARAGQVAVDDVRRQIAASKTAA